MTSLISFFLIATEGLAFSFPVLYRHLYSFIRSTNTVIFSFLFQENLRKHVLSTNLHPGKTIYECDVCQGNNPEPFRTNFAKELRAHLLEVHSDTFSTPGHANDYVIGIFKVHRSTDFVDEPN